VSVRSDAAAGAPAGVRAGGAEPRLTLPIVLSAALHGGALAALLFWRPAPPPPQPPVYAVRLEAAPPGERAAGVVRPEPPAPTPPAAQETPAPPPPPRAETKPTDMPLPSAKPVPPARRPAPPATPSLPTPKPPAAKPSAAKPAAAKPATPAPTAGGGPVGGRGTDVANVDIRGIAFPFPGYLANIVRQIYLNFKPRNPNAPLQADVRFLIHRDGSVTGVEVVKKSGSYAFDVEATGAIEAAGRSGSFGPLPGGFRDDVLPVTFSFDPAITRR
jgi:protein TonB